MVGVPMRHDNELEATLGRLCHVAYRSLDAVYVTSLARPLEDATIDESMQRIALSIEKGQEEKVPEPHAIHPDSDADLAGTWMPGPKTMIRQDRDLFSPRLFLRRSFG
jgi:hypothetical protein